jgi:phosphatidylglycerol lysyltransferase
MRAAPTTTAHAPGSIVALRLLREFASLLPAVLIGGAGLVAAIDSSTLHLGLLQPLPSLLPIDPDISEPATAAAAAIGLLGLSIGLARGKRVAWWLAIATLAAALLAQIELLRHVSAAILAAVCLGVLIADRTRYHVETSERSRRLAFVLWGIGALLAIAAVGVAVGQAASLVRPATDADAGEDAIVSWLAFGDPGFAIQHLFNGGLLLAATVTARVAVVMGVLAALAPGEAPSPTLKAERHAAAVARRYGQGALLPFQLGPEAKRFSPEDRDGLLAYGRDGRVAIVLGDPIGPEAEAHAVLDAFLQTCRRCDWLPAVYQASAAGVQPLRARGFVPYHIGLEAILDLRSFDLGGARRANLRHTITRARRGGVRVDWHPAGLAHEQRPLDAELLEVDHAWRLDGRPALGFTVNGYRRADLTASPVAVARDADGRMIAFTTFRPTGCDGGWVLDLMRRVPGGVPGAVEACIADAATALRDSGATWLSLGLAPLAGLDPRHGSPIERGLGVGARLIRGSYDVSGLAFFKAKFDPLWQPRYLAVARRTHLPAVLLALLRLHLGGSSGLLRAGWRLRPAG